MPLLLLGNKCDLEEEKQVTPKEAEEFCLNNNCVFKETSAKTVYNVKRAIDSFVNSVQGKK